jgi:hypothetical protein
VSEPFGVLDAAVDVGGAIGISGWAIDQVPGASPTNVRLFVGTQPVTTTLADRPRPDVAAAYPAFPGDHGFQTTVAVPPGTHLVCAYALDTDTGAGRFIGIALATVRPPLGSLDNVADQGSGNVLVEGWLADRARPAEPMIARIIVDGTVRAEVPANVERSDVGAGVPGIGPYHGFSWAPNVGPGSHRVCVDAVFASGVAVSMGCRDVVVT